MAAVLLSLGGASPVSAATTQPLISATPQLHPAFAANVTDYWTTCSDGGVQVTAAPVKGMSISVAGAPAASIPATKSIPLTSGRSFTWTLKTKTGSRTKTATFHARCVPSDMPLPEQVNRRGTTGTSFYLVNPGLPQDVFGKTPYIVILDGNGVPIWWRTWGLGPLNPTLFGNNLIAIWGLLQIHPINLGFGRWILYDLSGKVVGQLKSPDFGFDPHEIARLSNGNWITLTYRPVSPTSFTAIGGVSAGVGYRSQVRELSPKGEVKWTWNAEAHIGVDELADWVKTLIVENQRDVRVDGLPAFDVDHVSSIEPTRDGFILAARHLDAVYKVKKSTGEIEWKLGGTQTSKSLRIIGDSEPYPLAGPHDARAWPDGTVSVVDIGLRGPGQSRLPRVVRYRIDVAARTATVIQTFTNDAGQLSGCCGSARLLPNGNWVIVWGANRRFSEVDRYGNTVLEMTLPQGRQSYRVQPLTDRKITATGLRAAMDRSQSAPKN